ncbi:metal ABC transporter substrate-binding protein [Pelotomaculum propionicicum]|uniref:metal ABC transporter substrate-binding protein n=1 Tax=Pelotomaculum propionicicum TaxID=258475 RepID=UPI003B789398
MFKKASFLLVRFAALAFLLSFLTACGIQPANNSKEHDAKTIVINTTFYPIYIEALNITRDIPDVKLVNIAPPVTGCLHDYQLSPDDLKKMSEADILIINGAGMESFIDKIVSQLPELKIIDASRGIPLLKSEGDEYNPHVWVSITNAILQVKNIGEQIALLDPGHAAQYKANTEAYAAKLEDLRVRMHQVIDDSGSREIITFHEAFPYFAREFNLNITAVIEREPGSEPIPAELAETIDIINETGTKVIFAEPQYPAKSAETIARETGVKLYILDPAATGELEPDAYIKTMEKNMDVLREALNQ